MWVCNPLRTYTFNARDVSSGTFENVKLLTARASVKRSESLYIIGRYYNNVILLIIYNYKNV